MLDDLPKFQLVDSKDPILKEVIPPFDFNNPVVDPIAFSQQMYRTMIENGGIGLSANQVGYRVRMFVMYGEPSWFACFNPKIVHQEDSVKLEEGCLSFPNLILAVDRPKKIRVRFNSPTGEVCSKTFDGITARCFLHELDHLNGIVFTNLVSKLRLERAKTRRKKIYDV